MWCQPCRFTQLSYPPPKMEATLGAETARQPMTVTMQQEKLLKKLNLDGLSYWTPRNVAAARELILAFHDIFAWDGNELGCMSAIEHEFFINDTEPFKEWFRCILLPILEEVHALLRDMLDAGAICPSQSPWCNVVVLVRKKDGSPRFCVDFHWLKTHTKKDSYPLPQIQEVLECIAGATHFSTMEFKSRFLASKDGTRVPTVYSLRGGKSGILCVYLYALWALQCTGDFSMPHAEHLGRVELDILHHLFG